MAQLLPFRFQQAAGGSVAPTYAATGTINIDDDAADGSTISTVNPTNSPSPAALTGVVINGGSTDFEVEASGASVLIKVKAGANLTALIGSPPTIQIDWTHAAGSGSFDRTINVSAAAVDPLIGNATFNITDAYVNGQTVGTVPLENSPTGSPTYAITAGNTNSAFAINASTRVITVADELELVASNNYSLTVTATPGGDTATITVNVNAAGAGALDMTATAWNRTGGALTDHLVIMPVWASGTQDGGTAEWTAGDAIQLYQSDGTTELANYQLNNPASDRAGNKRLGFLAYIDSFTANQVKKPRAKATAGTPPSGAALTVANVKAQLDAMTTSTAGLRIGASISSTAFENTLNAMANSPSTTWTKTGPTRWVNSVDGLNWWEGMCATTFLLNCPLLAVSGGAPHASGDGIHIEIELTAYYKGADGAFNVSTNPILGLFGTVIIHNVAASTDYTVADFKIERATSIANGTLISTGDACWLDQHTNDYDFTGESFLAWRGGKFGITFSIGKKPILALPGDHTISAGLPTTKAMNTAAAHARITPYFPRSFAEITHDTSLFGALPDKPFTTNGAANSYGDVRLQITDTGGRRDFGLIPQWCQDGILRPDNTGLQRIFRNSNVWGTTRYQRHARDPDSGFLMPEPQTAQTLRSTTESGSDPWVYESDHISQASVLAYLQAGRHHDIDTMFSWQIGRTLFAANETVIGNSTSSVWDNETLTGNQLWKSFQSRGIGRNLNLISNLALVIPDRQTATDIHGPSKASYQLSLERTFTRAAACISRGFTLNQYVTGNALRFIEFIGELFTHVYWGFGEVANGLENARRHGNGDSNADTWLAWFDEYYAGGIEEMPNVWQWMIGQYRDRYQKNSDGSNTQFFTFLDFYTELASRKVTNSTDSWTRQAVDNVVATLSATSGSSVTVDFTLSGSPYSMLNPAFAAWYIGKWFEQHSGGNDSFGPGYAKITAVNSASQITIDTTVVGGGTFSATSLTHERWTLPPPHPDEVKTPPSVGYGINRIDFDFMQYGRGYNGLRGDGGITKCLNAFNTIDAVYPYTAGGNLYHNYEPMP